MRRNEQNKAGEHEVGKFTVRSGKLVVSDPCYQDGGGGFIDNVQNGEWSAIVELSDENTWGIRVATLRAHLVGSTIEADERTGFIVGVDAGQVCIVDTKNFAGGQGDYEESGTFYGDACAVSMSALGAGIFADGHGVNSSSGYGDGAYPCYIGRNKDGKVVSVRVVFISDEEDGFECIDCGFVGEETDENGRCPECASDALMEEEGEDGKV